MHEPALGQRSAAQVCLESRFTPGPELGTVQKIKVGGVWPQTRGWMSVLSQSDLATACPVCLSLPYNGTAASSGSAHTEPFSASVVRSRVWLSWPAADTAVGSPRGCRPPQARLRTLDVAGGLGFLLALTGGCFPLLSVWATPAWPLVPSSQQERVCQQDKRDRGLQHRHLVMLPVFCGLGASLSGCALSPKAHGWEA